MAENDFTIVLRGHNHYDEAQADEAIKPGQLVRLAADGNLDKEPKAKAEAIKGGLAVCVEGGVTSDGAGSSKTVVAGGTYASGDIIPYYTPVRGDRLNVLVKSGEDIAVGDVLNPEGGGSGLVVEAAGADAVYRFEARESSGGALGADTLLAVEVL